MRKRSGACFRTCWVKLSRCNTCGRFGSMLCSKTQVETNRTTSPLAVQTVNWSLHWFSFFGPDIRTGPP